MARPIGKLAVFFVMLALPAMASQYWPDQPDGTVYRYDSDAGGPQLVGVFDSEYGFSWGVSWPHHSASYVPIDSGTGLQEWADSLPAHRSPQFFWFDPPLEVARDGMQDGDSWLWWGTMNGVLSTCDFSVTAEAVDVPLGSFDTMRVDCLPGINCHVPFGTYWWHQGLGPVMLDIGGGDIYRLAAIENGGVQARAETLSSVKSLFR